MARLWHCGFELNSLTAEGFTTSGSPQILNGSPVRSGTYYARINGTSAGESIRYQFAASDQQGKFYFRGYFYIAGSPTNTRQIMAIYNTALSAQKSAITLTASNKLQLFGSSSQIGSDSLALTTNTWHRWELSVDTTTLASTRYEAKINGLTFATGTASLAAGIGQLLLRLDASDATYDIYHDDLAINDTSGSYQNSWCGDEKLLYLRPNAVGDSNGFLAQVGGTAGSTNNYTRVNEVTPDDATSYNGSAVLSAEDLFNCADSGIGASDAVNVVSVGVRMADLVSADATAAFKLEIEKAGAGIKAQSGTLIPNSTTWKTNASAAPFNYPLVTYNDPDGNPWTQTTLDSMQIGYIQTATNVQTIAVSNIWAVVAYIPATPDIKGNFMLVLL